MLRKSSKKKIVLITEDETALHQLFLNEFNDYFPSILSIPASEFIANLTKRVEYANAKKFNDFPNAIRTKVEEYFINTVFPSEYKIAFTAMKAIKKKLESNSDYQPFKGCFSPHCQSNSKALHSCRNTIYLFTYNKSIEGGSSVKESYLLCPKCDEVYKANFVKLNCNECNVDFYSTINSDNASAVDVDIDTAKYQLATWESYHCNVDIKHCMQCSQCQSPLYIDSSSSSSSSALNETMLICLKCSTFVKDKKVLWKCIKCEEEFHSKAKVLNPMEYTNIKLCIKEAIVNKDKAKPSKVPCCSSININQTKFYHDIKCKGKLVLGVLNQKKIIICSKCEIINDYANYQWSCPECNKKFTNTTTGTGTGTGTGTSINADNKPPIVKKLLIGSDIKERIPLCKATGESNRYSSCIRLNTDIKESKCEPSSSKVSTPFELVRERRITSVKKTNDDFLRVSLIKSPRESIRNSNNNPLLCKSGFKKHNNESLLSKSPLLPVKLNLANKFLKMKMINFEEDISPCPIAEDIIKENEVTKKIIKDNSESNFLSTASSNDQSEHSHRSTLRNSIRKVEDSSNKEKEKGEAQSPKVHYPPFEINDYKIIKQIGVGAFGKIYLVESIKKEQFAIKKIVGTSMEELQSLKSEYEILLSLHNKNKNLNLVQIKGIQSKQLDQTTFVMYVCMELAERDWEKELAIRCKAKAYYKEKELIGILSTLIKTFAHLQRHNISHRDIKPQNILLFANNEFKLADFGEAKILRSDLPDTNKQTLRGTELYMAPILFKALRSRVVDLKYVAHNTYKSDVFSFGLCALYAATLTFQSLYEIREVYDMERVKMSLFKYLSHRYTQGMIDLIGKMLDVNEKSRCDFIELEKAIDNYCN